MNIQPISIYNPNTQMPKPVEFKGRLGQKLVAKSYDAFVKSTGDVSVLEALRAAYIRSLESETYYLESLKSHQLADALIFQDLAYTKLDAPLKYEFAEDFKQAEEYAQKKLGIEDFIVGSKEIANIINNAITKVSNFANGDAFLPKRVKVCELDGNTLGRSSVAERTMLLNSKLFKSSNLEIFSVANLKAIIDKMYYTIFHEQGHFINMYKEILEITNPVSIQNIITNLEAVIKSRENIIELLEKQIKMYPKEDLSLKQKINLLLNRNKILTDIQNGNAERDELLRQFRQTEAEYQKYSSKRDDLIFPKVWGWEEMKIASQISGYAQTDENEFLAEVFAHICQNGLSSIPDDVMSLYKKYGGVILPNFPK